MSYRRILTVQDISCLGQCSLTVALPVISSCGIECCILPSAVLSTHTGGFSGFTFRDLSGDIPKIKEHWLKEGIRFDSLYTGYLGNTKHCEYVSDIIDSGLLNENSVVIIDPAMADHGRLYTGFDDEYVNAMASLCKKADFVIPNLTEAHLLTKTEYKTSCSKKDVLSMLQAMKKLGYRNIIVTGVSFRDNMTGVAVFENDDFFYYEHERLAKNSHGTGDIFASVFSAAITNGKSAKEAVKIAADFTLECLKNSAAYLCHTYGAVFEPVLYKLHDMMS